jgi:hypothetical protein
MLAAVHELVMLFGEHGKLSDELESIQRTAGSTVPLCLVGDVETRWTSVFDMFYRVYMLSGKIRRILSTFTLPRYQSKLSNALDSFNRIADDLPFMLTILWYCKTASDVMEETGSFLSSLLFVVSDLEHKLKVKTCSFLQWKPENV